MICHGRVLSKGGALVTGNVVNKVASCDRRSFSSVLASLGRREGEASSFENRVIGGIGVLGTGSC